jgi:hypothetical protein
MRIQKCSCAATHQQYVKRVEAAPEDIIWHITFQASVYNLSQACAHDHVTECRPAQSWQDQTGSQHYIGECLIPPLPRLLPPAMSPVHLGTWRSSPASALSACPDCCYALSNRHISRTSVMATLQKPAKKKRPHTQLQKTTTFSHHKSSQPHGFGLMGFFSVQQQVKSSSTEQDNRLMTRFLTPTTGKENYIGKKNPRPGKLLLCTLGRI